MRTREDYFRQIFNIDLAEDQFEILALEAYQHQFLHNNVYQSYCKLLEKTPETVCRITDIPFLPTEAYGIKKVSSCETEAKLIFRSSGTSGKNRSVHYVYDHAVYEQSFEMGFRIFYGNPQEYAILALLPSYLEQGESSLVYMVDKLMKISGHKENRFVLHDHKSLYEILQRLKLQKEKTLLIGVSYALLDFAEAYGFDFPELIIMETGGMKGKRKELLREELHKTLNESFKTQAIHSEYGMTELFSQAYSKGKGLFRSVPWLKPIVRDIYDPWQYLPKEKSGLVNVVDLANIDTCCFVSTEDIGRINKDNTFEILGRLDNSSLRGCNLLVD